MSSYLRPQPIEDSISHSIDTTNKDISRLIDAGIALDQLEEIREGFELFENPKNQRADLEELLIALDSMGFSEKYPTICKVMQDIAKDYRNGVRFEAFLRELSRRMGDTSTRKEIRKIFDLFDKKRKGMLDVDDFKLVAREIGETLSDEELTELIQESAQSADDIITPDDFYHMMIRSTEFGKNLRS